jgi:glycosyltransferase involved in cell wall biosynthesis
MTSVQSRISIALCTHNGGRYLTSQLDSLISQSVLATELVASDDGSTDETLDILQEYAKRSPFKVKVHRNTGKHGAVSNFSYAITLCEGDYIALCDQDDVWASHKLHTLLASMQAIEARLGQSIPILVHSDLAVVDRDLRPIHPSFWAYSGIDPDRQSLAQLLAKNTVTGCTFMANRALVERALPIPDGAAMHDHWLALVAAAFGHIEAVPETLVAYRQHGCNTVGAQPFGWRSILRQLVSGCGRMDIARLRRQAEVFHLRFSKHLDPGQADLVEGFARLQDQGWWGRRLFLLRHGILLPGVVRNLALLFCVRLGK